MTPKFPIAAELPIVLGISRGPMEDKCKYHFSRDLAVAAYDRSLSGEGGDDNQSSFTLVVIGIDRRAPR